MNFIKNISKEEAKDAFRLAIQSALAGAICYYLMILFGISERFVGVLSAILVIEPSIGNTFQQAKGRLLSTIVGIVIGFIFVALIPWELGVILSLLLSLFIINGIASFRPEWRYGVVAAVALALGSEGEAFDLALNRLLSIGFGVAVGILISLIVWPDTSENRTLRYIRKALKNTCDRFKIEFSNTRDKKNKKTTKANNNFSTNINQAKNTLASVTFNDKSTLKEIIENTERLYNSITIIKRVANRSNNNITNGESGVEKNSEEVTEKACEIIDSFARKKEVSEDEIDKFSDLINKTKNNIQIKVDDKELSLLRNTFMFGLTEIEESIKKLFHNFKS
jgi:uncharacterized membrane protein YccC